MRWRKDVLERAPPDEHALGHEPPLVDPVRGGIAVVRVEEHAVRQRLHARNEPVRPVGEVVRPGVAEAQLDDFARRVALDQLSRRSLGDDLPLVHDDEAVAELLGLLHVVRRQEQCHALALEPVEPVPDDVARLRVQPGRRLVQQKHLRVVDERPGDRQPALHPARERLHAILGAIGELDELEQLVGPLAQHRAGKPEVAPVDDDVLAHGQLHVERVLLGNDSEPSTDRDAVSSRVEPEDAELPVRDRGDAADHAHRRRLPGAVRTEETEGLASLEVEVDRVDCGELAEALDEPAGLDERFSVPAGHALKATDGYPAGGA